jgi:2-methylcitrate dehydratase PrpD
LDAIFQETDKAPAEVRIVRVRNRKELSGAGDYPRGCPQNPVTQTELEEKFIDLAAGVFNNDRALEIIRLVYDLENQNHLTGLVRCLTA